MGRIDIVHTKVRKLLDKAGWASRAAVRAQPELEFVVSCEEPAFIEPATGYVITERGVLLESSLLPNFAHKAPWRVDIPSPRAFARAISKPGATIVDHDCVISLRHLWEWNFYHFFLDVLGKLELLALAGFDTDVPLCVGSYAHDLAFARETLAMGSLASRNWIVSDTDASRVVRAQRIIFCRTRRPFAKRVDHLRELIGAPTPDSGSESRIFLTRRPPVGRCLSNEAEVIEVLEKFGFRTIDAAAMSMGDQVSTFAQARHVVALHGAGVTNIIFRGGAPLNLLELHATTFGGPGDMRRLCAELRYGYDDIGGQQEPGDPIHVNYAVDPSKLERAVVRMLAGPSSEPA